MIVTNLVVVWHDGTWPWANAAYTAKSGKLINNINLHGDEKISVDNYGDRPVFRYELPDCVYGVDPDADFTIGEVTTLPIAEHQTLHGEAAIAFLKERGLC